MKHKTILKVCTAAFIFFLSMNAYSLINFNGAGDGYQDPLKPIATSNTLEYYIIESAGYYLTAGANIHKVLNMVECQDTQGLDLLAVNNILDMASDNMKKACETFIKLIQEAERTPYNKVIQARLKTFAYNSFADANNLNPEIFADVKKFLKHGDITGTFKKAHSEMAGILALLQTIKSETSIGNLPQVEIFWKLNEKYAAESLFGSYIARVFAELK